MREGASRCAGRAFLLLSFRRGIGRERREVARDLRSSPGDASCHRRGSRDGPAGSRRDCRQCWHTSAGNEQGCRGIVARLQRSPRHSSATSHAIGRERRGIARDLRSSPGDASRHRRGSRDGSAGSRRDRERERQIRCGNERRFSTMLAYICRKRAKIPRDRRSSPAESAAFLRYLRWHRSRTSQGRAGPSLIPGRCIPPSSGIPRWFRRISQSSAGVRSDRRGRGFHPAPGLERSREQDRRRGQEPRGNDPDRDA